jgi:hypothetical protein
MTDAPLPPQPPLPPQWPYGAPQPPTSGKAIAALVLGIVGLVMCGCFPVSIVAWVMGKQAEREIRESSGALSGDGLARAGWITGVIGTVLSVLFLLGYVAFLGAMFTLGEFEDSSGY